MRNPTPPHPRLCEAGPCVNYHRLEIQIDAESARPMRVPGGSVYQPPMAFHHEVQHYCYPTAGVEMALGSLPVITCNRWHPMSRKGGSSYDPADTHHLESDRVRFLASPDGKRYASAVAEWKAAREQELAEAAEAERLIEEATRKHSPQPGGDSPVTAATSADQE